MKNHADYRVICFSDDAVFIEDLDIGNKSITNDAEHVVSVLLREYGRTRRIVYKDSMGQWDELQHDGTNFLDFGPWKGSIPE